MAARRDSVAPAPNRERVSHSASGPSLSKKNFRDLKQVTECATASRFTDIGDLLQRVKNFSHPDSSGQQVGKDAQDLQHTGKTELQLAALDFA